MFDLIIAINNMSNAALDEAEKNLAKAAEILNSIGGQE